MALIERRLIPLACVVGAYMAVGMVLILRQWNQEFLYYWVVTVVEIACVLWLTRRAFVPLWILWGMVLWGLVHMCGGTIMIPAAWADPGSSGTLYNLRIAPWLPRYDQVVHACGFGLAAAAVWCGLRTMLHPASAGKVGVWVIVWLAGMGIGALNEVIEFVAVLTMPWTNVGGYVNTGWDLVSNSIGCGVAATWAVWESVKGGRWRVEG